MRGSAQWIDGLAWETPTMDESKQVGQFGEV